MRIFMNDKENLKKVVIEACVNGQLTVKQAANRLHFSERYIKKLKQNYRKNGEKIFIHGNCGKQPISTISAETRSKIVALKQSDIYEEANFTHFTEMIQEDEKINVSYSSVTRILKEKGIKSPRKHKKQVIHRRRERLPQKGQMLQMDGTPFQFFKGNDELYSLHGFIDDATGIVTGLYMCKNECLQGYLEVLRQTLRKYGAPQSIYTDGTNIMFNNLKKEVSIEDQLKGIEEYSTRYGEILDHFGIEPIHANSAQAKGRIERLWNTLHDRLRFEFNKYGVKDIEAANKFLPDFLKRYNEKFSVKPKNNKSAFVKLPKGTNLDLILTAKLLRTPDVSNTISIKNQKFKIECKEILHKKRLEILISKKIGVKALYNGKLYALTPLNDKELPSTSQSDSIENILNQYIFFYCFRNVKEKLPIF